MPLDADIYGHKDAMAPSFAFSTALHAALLACVVFLPAVLSRSGEDWGNNGSGGAAGGAISAHLVSGIPLPPNPHAKPENVLANESKGLSQSIPAPKAKEDDHAIALPDRNSKVKPAKEKTATTAPGRDLVKQRPTAATPTHEAAALGAHLRIVLMGSWGAEAGAAAERLAAAFERLANDPLGHLLGLDQPVQPAVSSGDRDALALDVVIDPGTLARGLHAVTEATIAEILSLSPAH